MNETEELPADECAACGEKLQEGDGVGFKVMKIEVAREPLRQDEKDVRLRLAHLRCLS